MRRLCVFLGLVACSGDDGHRQPTMPTHGAPAAPAADTHPAAPPTPAPPTAPPGTPAPFSEAMAVPYFQSGDAAAGVQAFAAQKWSEARTAFEAARKTATGDTAARLDLLLGLTNAQLNQWTAAATQLGAARTGLPLLADYIGYHQARALYYAQQRDAALAIATSIARDSIVGAEAEMLIGDLLVAQ